VSFLHRFLQFDFERAYAILQQHLESLQRLDAALPNCKASKLVEMINNGSVNLDAQDETTSTHVVQAIRDMFARRHTSLSTQAVLPFARDNALTMDALTYLNKVAAFEPSIAR
jgi:hypothetical protein